jgi:hypothetical protein
MVVAVRSTAYNETSRVLLSVKGTPWIEIETDEPPSTFKTISGNRHTITSAAGESSMSKGSRKISGENDKWKTSIFGATKHFCQN